MAHKKTKRKTQNSSRHWLCATNQPIDIQIALIAHSQLPRSIQVGVTHPVVRLDNKRVLNRTTDLILDYKIAMAK